MRAFFPLLLGAAAFAAATPASAQFLADRKVWLLQTEHSTYAMGVNPRGELQHIYWGAKLWRPGDLPNALPVRGISSFDPSATLTPEEYPAWGGARFEEPALKITRADGDRDVVLHYVAQHTQPDGVDIELKDIDDDIFVTLRYRVFQKEDIVSRQSVIENRSKQRVMLESAQSAAWSLPPGESYRLSYLTGRWAAETQLIREPIHTGMKILESRRGNTSHNLNPWFAIDQGDATEEHGRVWFGALAWSGNWRIAVEQTPYQQVRVTGGFNTFDFGYPLAPGEKLETPQFYAGFSGRGFGEASRLMHRLEREHIAPAGRLRPVLYNSWEATGFHVDEAGQKALAQKAARLGVELFVIDDGWFGARNNDRAGLGDWTVNKQKFPNGLEPLIAEVNRLGMDFGLWVEPEMVNPDSDLYRQHPDWAIHFPGRPRTELRNQLVLNLARDDVKDYVYGFLDRLASTYKIKYFKWDMTRSFAEPGWPAAAPDEQKKLWVRYVRNLYDIMDRLRARHPGLEIESCSGGGARIDLGILRRVEEFWTSDNTEGFDRLRIQEGFSQAYAAKLMSAWVTDVPNMNGRSVPLQYRFMVAMQGALGVGANLNKWSAAEEALAARLIALDKQIRATVQTGDLYRLRSPREGDVTANQYVAADGKQSVLFAFRHSQEYTLPAPTLALQGLDAKAVYSVKPWNAAAQEWSGAYLMQRGLDLDLKGDFDSTVVVLQKQ